MKFAIVARHFTAVVPMEDLDRVLKFIIQLELNHGIHKSERYIDIFYFTGKKSNTDKIFKMIYF